MSFDCLFCLQRFIYFCDDEKFLLLLVVDFMDDGICLFCTFGSFGPKKLPFLDESDMPPQKLLDSYID